MKKIILLIITLILLSSYASAINVTDAEQWLSFKTTYNDSTPNNRDGTKVGSVSIASEALDCPGDGTGNNYVDTNRLEDINFSVSIWVNRDDTGVLQHFWGGTNAIDRYYCSVQTNNHIGCRLDSATYLDTGVDTGTSNYTHFVMTFNDESNAWKFYVNGVQTNSFTREVVINTQDFYICTQNNVGTPSSTDFDGQIRNYGLYDRVLNQTEVTYLYDSGNSSFNPYDTPAPVAGDSFKVYAYNIWNSSVINVFNATVNGTMYSTTNGTIITSYNQSQMLRINITTIVNNHFNETRTWNITNNLNQSVKQSIITPICIDEQSNTITCSNTTIYPNTGTYNITQGATGYYDITELKTITLYDNTTSTWDGFYSKIIGFTDDVTGNLISGMTCNVDGVSYTQDNNKMIYVSVPAYTNKNLTCSKPLFYPAHSWTLNTTKDTINLTITEYKLKIYFSAQTNGTITDVVQQVNFSNTSVILKQSAFPIGKVTVRWSEQYNSTQVMEYYNNQDETITLFMKVLTDAFDRTRKIRVTSNGVALRNARVTSEEWNGTAYVVVYGKLTDTNGEAEIYTEDYKDYRVTAQKVGYDGLSTIMTTSPDDTRVITMDLSKSTGAFDNSYISTCTGIVRGNTTCYFQTVCNDLCSNVTINYTAYLTNGSTTTGSTQTSTTTGVTNQIPITSNINFIEIDTYVDGDKDKSYNISYEAEGNMTQPFTNTLVTSSENASRIWIILILISGIIIAGLTEKKVKKETGIYAMGAWYLIWGTIMPVFYVIAGIIGFLKLSLTIIRKVYSSD